MADGTYHDPEVTDLIHPGVTEILAERHALVQRWTAERRRQANLNPD